MSNSLVTFDRVLRAQPGANTKTLQDSKALGNNHVAVDWGLCAFLGADHSLPDGGPSGVQPAGPAEGGVRLRAGGQQPRGPCAGNDQPADESAGGAAAPDCTPGLAHGQISLSVAGDNPHNLDSLCMAGLRFRTQAS